MATHAPTLQSAHTPSKLKRNKKAKPFLSVAGRKPAIQIAADAISSSRVDALPEGEPGTVIAAGKFKATCLQLLDRVAKGETITITKRGRIVGRLVPPHLEPEKPFVPLLGRMEGMVRIDGDIVGPRFDWWENK